MVTPQYFPHVGGVETHVYETSRRLRGRGLDVRILTTDPSHTLDRHERVAGVPVTRVPSYPSHRDWMLAPHLLSEMRALDPDLVHVQSIATAVAPEAMLTALSLHVPFIVTFHSGGHSSLMRRKLRWLQWLSLRPLLSRSSALVAVSEFETRMFGRWLHRSRSAFDLIPNGVEPLAAGEPLLDIPTDLDPLVLTIGRLEKYKGHHRVVKALPAILAERPSAGVVVVGKGPYERALRDLAIKLNVTDRVLFRYVEPSHRATLAALMQRASVVAMLSQYESQGLVVLEALSTGVPVVTGQGSGLAELQDAGMTTSVPWSAPADVVARAILAAVGTRPPNVALPQWDDCVAGLVGIYDRVLEGRHAGTERN